MKGTVYVYDPAVGAVVEKSQKARPSGGPFVISDTMDALAHPCTGRMMDSKSEFRRVTRAHGCEEVGSSAFPTQSAPRNDIAADLRRSLQQHGY